MIRKLIGLLQPRYRTLNSVEISRSALVYNYNYLIKRSGGKKIAPVLKSNAYGHGIVEVAKILDPERPSFFCVDSIFEAYQLLKARIKSPILIMGYVHPDNLKVKKLPFIFNVYTVEMLEAIHKHQPEVKVHIFVDTGMHREGVPLDELADFIKKAKELDIQIDGLTSHFAMAEKIDNPDTRRQVEKFKKSISLFNDYGIYPTWVHISASTGLLNSEIYNSLGNLSRGGIALYGIDLLDSDENLQPVLKLTSTVIQIKELKKGEKIGYDFTHTAEKNMKTAILPIGYNDGIDRRLSDIGFVQIRGTYCRILGRVSMNITVVDVSDLQSVSVGDKVVIYSSNQRDDNSIDNVAITCKTIPYEILVHIFPTTKRMIVK